MVMVRRLPTASDLLESRRPRFVSEPMGIGTFHIEALSSLFCRIADRHWMFTIQLWNAIADYDDKVRPNNWVTYKRYLLRSMNGHGRVTSTVVALFEREGLPVDQLTLLPWRGVLEPMAHGLLRSTLAWCPLCWWEDEESGDPIYIRLLWVTALVTVCPKHCVELQTICRTCGSAQDVLPRIPRLSICKSCGADLTQQHGRRRGHPRNSDGKAIWIASVIASLIRGTCAAGVHVSPGAFQNALKLLAARYFNGSFDDLADACGMSRRMIRQWATGVTRPYLTALLEFSYRTQIPLDMMLLHDVGLTDPGSWLKAERPTFVKRFHKLSRERLDEIRQRMKDAINAKNVVPISIKQFAKTLGTTYTVLWYHFPNEYKLLQARTRKKYLENVKILKEARIERVIEAARSLALKGIYPSERALKRACIVIPSDLRREDVKRKLRVIRLEFLAGTYAMHKRKMRRSGNIS